MDRKVRFLLPIFAFLSLAGCENEIDLFRSGQEKTYVVFGILNSTDPLQQVKVRMTSVTDAAIRDIGADSAEFSASPDLEVSLQEWQGEQYALFPMIPVRYAKDPGVFFETRNDIYETRLFPNLDMYYKLIIRNPDDGQLVESGIRAVPQPKLGAPTWPWIHYNFSLENDPFNIRFYEVPRVRIFMVRFTIRFVEFLMNGDSVFRKADWAFPPVYCDDPPSYSATRDNSGDEHSQHMPRNFTLRVIQQLIPVDPEVHHRQLICFEAAVWGGDENVRNYVELGAKFSDNRKLSFSNISNGIGFFGACSYASCTGILPDPDFMEMLSIGTLTSSLRFVRDLYPYGHEDKSRPENPFLTGRKEARNE